MQTGFIAALNRRLPKGWTATRFTALSMSALAFAAYPETTLQAVGFAARNLILISPVILLGVAVTAGVTASGSMALIAAAFKGREGRTIVLASFIGALTPVCGVTVLPLVAGLLAAGVPLAPIMAFWLSSPITAPSMLAVTAAVLGLPFAVGKTLAAFAIGLFAGTVVLFLARAGAFASPAKSSRHLEAARAAACCGGEGASKIRWRFWQEAARRRVFGAVALDSLRLMLLWLTLAFLAEYVLGRALPETLIADTVGGEGPWVVPLAALVGTPIYLDGYAALPLVRGLIDLGMRPDAAMAFLVAGGITSAWAAIPVFALVRVPVFALYLALAFSGSILAGWAFGLVVM